jgi:hypothetical protein
MVKLLKIKKDIKQRAKRQKMGAKKLRTTAQA